MRDIVIATLKAGTGQVTALVCAIASVKILAVLGGPVGVGLFSLLRQIQQTLCAFASLGGQNAIVQGVASRSGGERDRFVLTILLVVSAAMAIVVLCMLALAPWLAALLLGADDSDPALIRWITIPVILGALLIFFRSLLNARMHIGAVAWVNIATAFGSLLLAVPAALAYNAGYHGALILILGGALGLGLLSAIYQSHARRCFPEVRRAALGFRQEAALEFFKVALPSLTALFFGMGCILAVRASIARLHGLSVAGQFDAAWSISVTLLIVFLTSLQAYLLPKLSASQAKAELQDVLQRTLRLAVMIAVPAITALIVLKPLAVRLLYSGEFMQALEVLRWTLIGDYLRVAGWVLATTLIARADMRVYLGCELLWNTLFTATTLACLADGIAGAGPAYVGAYGAYLAVLIWRVCVHHAIQIQIRTFIQWIVGVGIVLAASALTWSDVKLGWPSLAVIPGAALFSWLIMTAAERRFVVAQIAHRTRLSRAAK